jgi:Fe2+ or Zn2+ uptake regulation protein
VGIQQVDDILAALRVEGGRATVQRRAVVTALLKAPRHVTAEELADCIHGEHPEIATTTVYRTLDALERQGIVEHAHLGHGPAVYHLAGEDHLHLVCKVCGRVTEVPRSIYGGFEQTLVQEFDFEIAPHHFAMQGRCASCVSRERI